MFKLCVLKTSDHLNLLQFKESPIITTKPLFEQWVMVILANTIDIIQFTNRLLKLSKLVSKVGTR